MSLGFNEQMRVVNLGDTAEVYAYLYARDDSKVGADELFSVLFTIQKPDGEKVDQDGDILSDGAGFLRFTDTELVGEYKAVARFEFADTDEVRSVRNDFQVIDPFQPPLPTDIELVAEATWDRLEDCFDSEEGGPWLRDMTMAFFDPTKITMFIGDAIFGINQTNPPTASVLSDFTASPDAGLTRPDLPLLVQGTLVTTIRHLMRSYAEQPQPMGAQVVYEDRREYLQRWGTIYQIESQLYQQWLILWKRRFLQMGSMKVLVGSKAGRLLPAPLRSRSMGRGYY